VQGKSKAEIVERFSHAPMGEGQEIEIRQLFEADDFGDYVPQSAREQRQPDVRS
jgi:hypothetical protein